MDVIVLLGCYMPSHVAGLLNICGCLVDVGGCWVVGYLWLLGHCY